MSDEARRFSGFCERAAQFVGAGLFALLALSGLFTTAHLGKQSWSHEAIVFTYDGVLTNLIMVAALSFVIGLICKGLFRFSGVRAGGVLLGAWCVGTLLLVVGANITQMYDFAYVIEGAELFSQGNYKLLKVDYFNVYSYQLGICLPMEILKRVLPGLNLSLFMQGLNVLFSAVTAGAMAAFAQVFFGEKEAKATLVLYLLFMPMALQCIFVYGTLPMLMMTALAMLCFALYLKKRKICYALGFTACMAAAYVLKINAVVPMIALVICALLDVMHSRDWKLLLFAVLSVLFAVGGLRAVIMQYELRAGVTLTEDVSMLARLVMGLQRGGAEAGWFNRYTERFFSLRRNRTAGICDCFGGLGGTNRGNEGRSAHDAEIFQG